MRCINCFEEYDNTLDVCPFCGYAEGDMPKEPYVLVPGTILNGRYQVGKEIGIGGFGITYKAIDTKLDVVVAIKEYYPSGLVNRVPGTKDVVLYAVNRRKIYDHGKQRFLDEARNMAKFSSHKNIVNVYEYFEENGTAYIAMEFLDGQGLDIYLRNNDITLEQSVNIVTSICNALKELHNVGIVHRDISPDNIFMCKNGAVKLLDFGAARFSKDEDQQLTIILKPGYAPPEQYEKVNTQGPWTDIYALGATMYLMLTGEKPEESTNRKIKDEVPAPSVINPDIPENISNSVMKAMAIDVHMRFQTIDEFEKGIRNQTKVLTIVQEKKKRKIKRNIGILAAIGVVVAGGLYFYINWEEQKEENTLPPATIDFWYMVSEDADIAKDKTDAMEAVINEFMGSYENVTVVSEAIPSDEYLKKIKEAQDAGNLPDIYETTGLTDDYLIQALSIKGLLDNEIIQNNYFLSDYDNWYMEDKKIPFGFAAYTVFVNKSLLKEYPDKITGFADIQADIISDDINLYAIDDECKEKYEKFFGVSLNDGVAPEKFYNGKALFYLADTSSYSQVVSYLPARYRMLQLDLDKVPADLALEFSMTDGGKDETTVSKRLLKNFLKENAQDYLHIQHNSGLLPLCKNKISDLQNVYKDYTDFFNNIDKYDFK